MSVCRLFLALDPGRFISFRKGAESAGTVKQKAQKKFETVCFEMIEIIKENESQQTYSNIATKQVF